mmetsp:Transcript_10197/g.15251  ORF Transcript_10197/g.15251 Transcript_10197/m.15251 type:complete len:910 (-) Transcript_10197:124-2853(-)|eukprot:CAMPEP_0167740042 /NCGR_PEP_ID=MMETSP0110_2-20121227/56_1 /TAXON_ID=629695 /ORGANISM="Gymnochlora sp., Strain CCMP2014" /LENGTH=909 /DNA_ID=CAMNT_0007623889 /DNA_START=62 /DNA_END=2791 /DNA_ORIENTATION=+
MPKGPNCCVQSKGEWVPAIRGRKVKNGFEVSFPGEPGKVVVKAANDVKPLSFSKKRSRKQLHSGRPGGYSSYKNRENIRINGLIMRSRDVGALKGCILKFKQSLNIINCMTALNRLAKLSDHSQNPNGIAIIQEISSHTSQLLHNKSSECRFRQIANGIWACGKLASPKSISYLHGLMMELVSKGLTLASEAKAQEISNTIWGIGKMCAFSESNKSTLKFWTEFGKLLEKFSPRLISEMNGQGLANSIWGLAKLGPSASCIPWSFLDQLLRQLKESIQRMNPQECVNSLWGWTKLLRSLRWIGDRRAELKATTIALLNYLETNRTSSKGLTAQQLANACWAKAVMISSLHCEYSFDPTKSGDIFNDGRLRFFKLNVQEKTMILSSFASIPVGKAPGLWENVLQLKTESKFENGNIFSHLSAPQLIITLQALCKSNRDCPKALLDALQSCFRNLEIRDLLSSQDVSALAWSIAKLSTSSQNEWIDERHTSFLTLAADRSCALMESKSGMNPKHLSLLIWSLAKTRTRHDQMVDLAAHQSTKQARDFNPRDLANMAWGLAMMNSGNAKLRKQAVASLAKEARAKFNDFNAQEASKFLWAISKCSVKDPELDQLAMKQTTLSFTFPNLGEAPVNVQTIRGGGRNLKHTGTAVWDASFILAEFLSRQSKAGSSILKPFLSKSWKKTLKQKSVDGKSLDFSDIWEGKKGIEIGAGMGLPSIVLAKKGVNMTTTDGDPRVLELLKTNMQRNPPSRPTPIPNVTKLSWGEFKSKKEARRYLSVDRGFDVIIGSGIIYGADEDTFSSLALTMSQLSDKNTMIILAHGQGAAPGVHKGEGLFFTTMKRFGFRVRQIKPSYLHEDYQDQQCFSVHILRLMTEKEKKSKKTRKAKALNDNDGRKKKRLKKLKGLQSKHIA